MICLSVCPLPDKLNHTDGNFNALQLHHINFHQCDLTRPVCLIKLYHTDGNSNALQGSWRFLRDLSVYKLNHTDRNCNALQWHHINFRQCDLTRPYVCLLSSYITLTEIQMHYKVPESYWRFLMISEGSWRFYLCTSWITLTEILMHYNYMI